MAGSPNVRVEGGAISCLRYSHLGSLLGTSRYDALGRMVTLWHHCTVQQTYVLGESLVATVLDPNALVESLLGERVDGGIRIKGTVGRIEWYGNLQESGRKAAAKRWKKQKRKPNGSPNGLPLGGPKEEEKEEDSSLSSSPGKRGLGRGGLVEHELPADWQPTPEHASLAAELKLELATEVAKFRAHAEANVRKQKRWNASFTGWLHNAPKFARGTPARGTPVVHDRAAEIWAEAQRLREEGR